MAKNMLIDATRGKPSQEQVALCNEMLNMPLEDFRAENGADVRNYGGLDGLPEMKRIFADLLRVDASEVIVGGNSSLNMMFDFIAQMRDVWGPEAKFICPVPGYDRHFSVCEYFGIKMLTVPMTPTGPDMDAVEELADDPKVAGIWCVPVFSNPQGYVYSDETVRRLARMNTANPNFRIMWDDAYTAHNFIGERPAPANIMAECKACGNEARPVLFMSFSKISFAGAGVACMAAAGETLVAIRRRLSMQTIGPDKINQLRHARYFKDAAGVLAHMKKHAEILRPKFECVSRVFESSLTGATFTKPAGGYFVTVQTPIGTAKRVRETCKNAGVLLTEAGATFPYGNDPSDSFLRVAPSYLSMNELEQALEIFCAAVKEITK